MPVTSVTFRQRFASDARAILRLAGPLIVNNVAVAGMSFTDTLMAGRLSAGDLAAVAVGSAFHIFFYLTGLGILMAMSPLVAHAYGAGHNERVGHLARQALWLSQLIALVMIVSMLNVKSILQMIGIDPAIVPKAAGFVYAISCGIPGVMAFLALRFVSEGIGWTRPIMYTALTALIANVVGCYVFMYGKLGFPALGAVGTGVSSALVMWIMLAVMVAYVRRHRVYRPYALFKRFEPPDWRSLREILALGLPISGAVISEGALFVAAALIMGTMGAAVVAAHQIAINYAALMFMIPLSIHSATTIHVGHALGAGRFAAGRWAGFVGIALCGLFMACSAVVILFAGEHIAALYTRDEAVRTVAAGLLLMAAIFQISDGLQIGSAGALRGFKDAQVPMLLNLVAYWAIGFPLAYGLGVAQGLGPTYVWVGLIAGLTASAVLLGTRFHLISRRAVLAATGGTTLAAQAAE
ncbi:MAG TPA: MATE family efflux transporter [Steroidobacteraceae bacterium]|nr:MATE family efflux transporter [Steroidobacteraceae bacterium]